MAINKNILNELTNGLLEIFGSSEIRIILYGSAARGTQDADSDVDIALIIPSHTSEMYDKMIDFIVDMGLKYDTVFSVHIIDSAKFLKWENIMPYYRNIKEEGIVLWPAA